MTCSVHRRHLLALASGAAASGLPLLARAQQAAFAKRPIKVMVPFAAGGATDVIARVLGERMAKTLGQSVIVDNKPGAAGLIAGEAVVKAAPDGLNVLLGTTTTMLTNKYLYKKPPYDSLADLLPLVRVCTAPICLVVTSDVPVKDMKEFMAWIKANKGKLSYGSYGIGSHGHLACAALSQLADADMTHVAYKGEALMVQDMLGGNVKMGLGSMIALKPHIDSGKLRALAVTGNRRVPLLPQVPTFAEAGLKSDALNLVGWLAMAAPKALPADIAQQWAKAANEAVASREGKARIIAAGFVPVDNDTVAAFGKDWQREGPIWGKLLQQAGVEPN
jgi:tripartite-type tricarboxylate transporter receptor subunit TctC